MLWLTPANTDGVSFKPQNSHTVTVGIMACCEPSEKISPNALQTAEQHPAQLPYFWEVRMKHTRNAVVDTCEQRWRKFQATKFTHNGD